MNKKIVFTLLFLLSSYSYADITYSDCTAAARDFKRSTQVMAPRQQVFLNKTQNYPFFDTPYFTDLKQNITDIQKQTKDLNQAIQNTLKNEDYITCVEFSQAGSRINESLANLYEILNKTGTNATRDFKLLQKENHCSTTDICNQVISSEIQKYNSEEIKQNLEDISTALKSIIKRYDTLLNPTPPKE